MKKIIAAILLAAMAFTLFSCASAPELVKMDAEKVSGVNYVISPDTEAFTEDFVEAYNKAEVVGEADEEDKRSKEVIVVVYNDGDDHFTFYYLEDNRFTVTGSLISTAYVIEAPELAKVYNSAVHPDAEFVKIEAEKFNVYCVKKPDVQVDGIPFVKAYNEAEFEGNADGENSGDTLVFSCNDGEYVFAVSYLGEGRFNVSGTKITVPYIISSERLEELYLELVK